MRNNGVAKPVKDVNHSIFASSLLIIFSFPFLVSLVLARANVSVGRAGAGGEVR